MNALDVGDPSVNLSAKVAFGGSVGWLRFLNYSPYGLDVKLNRGTFRMLPYTPRDILADVAESPIAWTIAFALGGASSSTSDLTIEAYDENEPRPPLPPGFGTPLVSVGTTVVANELGTAQEGLTVSVPSNPAVGTGTQTLFPYVTVAAQTRSIILQTLLSSVATNALALLAATAFGLVAGDAYFYNNLGINGYVRSDNSNFKTDGALGTLATYGGLATVGLGVAAQRAKGDGIHITTTTANQTIATLTTPNDGARHRYRVGGRVRVNNGTSGNNITFRCAYTDFDSGGAVVVWFTGNPGSADVTFGGAASITNNVYSCTDRIIDCTPNTAITIQYTDPTNTPNDNVSGYIEQLT